MFLLCHDLSSRSEDEVGLIFILGIGASGCHDQNEKDAICVGGTISCGTIVSSNG